MVKSLNLDQWLARLALDQPDVGLNPNRYQKVIMTLTDHIVPSDQDFK